jgi:hypothetical protein
MGNEVGYKISDYERRLRELEKEYGISKPEFSKIEEIHFKMMDGYILGLLFPEGEEEEKRRDSVLKLNDLPVNGDPELMKEYTGWLKFESGIYRYQSKRYLSAIKNSAIELLALMKEKYHLD